MIKKVVLVALVVVFLGIVYSNVMNYYDMNGTVYSIEGDTMVLLDKTDNLWEIDYTDALKVGDNVKITFYTNGTDNERIDDKIVSIIKEGE
jgi:archaellum component FlaF (FlaF/FlaG flagellin family)